MYPLAIVRSDYGNLEDLKISVRTTWLMTGQTRPRNAGDDKLLPSPNHRMPHDCTGSAETRRIRPIDVFDEAASHLTSGCCQSRSVLIDISCTYIQYRTCVVYAGMLSAISASKTDQSKFFRRAKPRSQFYSLIHNYKRREQCDLLSLLLSGFSTYLVILLMALGCPCVGESSHFRKSFITREPGH